MTQERSTTLICGTAIRGSYILGAVSINLNYPELTELPS